MLINIQNIHIQPLPSLSDKGIQTDILRLDLVHPVISGNKWFKLKYYIEEARNQGTSCLAGFGGAYSNHIVALAYAAQINGFRSRGFIRGDENTPLSSTLLEAKGYGMELIFIDRNTYRNKEAITHQYHQPGYYWIPEGGYGILGAKGAADILSVTDCSAYSHIICATGTGTMMSGLLLSAQPHQKIIGISVLKNHISIVDEIKALIGQPVGTNFECVHGYDFGGYAKHPEPLLTFMRGLWQQDQLPTDIVYTAKLCYAVKDLIAKHFFPENSKLLLIHSGGLQGNRSLAPGNLPF
ncbi:pyridoxal-phosphate dependent enzyme [Sediminibacterium sp.]|uniref:1-aminocyclopropane-1-carboxylate deaminase/D-cysteine desulfhydrase n=1 Tax=Sediminibacterium sp. TaxID=1917865 RepID=UPI0025F756CD|nr:pyridoxal-phosphate dependent enzyme [Sediminibacterium sp.]MBW0177474.1 pyridoxal-phosphate dependent enzyme [Sediminibacterium sp.]